MNTFIRFALTAVVAVGLIAPGAAFAAGSISSATVDGAAVTNVLPSASITAAVTVDLTGGTMWRSTFWQITGGPSDCDDHEPDYPAPGGTESFSITAPATPGTYDVTFTGHTADGCGGNSASITLTGGIVVVANQSITFGALADATYGDADFSVSATGGASGNPVTFASQTSGVCTTGDTNGTTVHIVSAGTCTIRASQAGNGSYNAAPDTDQSFTVLQKELTLTGMTASDHTYDGSVTTLDEGTISGGTLNGVIGLDDVTFIKTAALFGVTDGNVMGSPHAVLVSGITLTGTAAGNYTLTQPTDLTVNVLPLPVTITAQTGQTKVFGAADPTLVYDIDPVSLPDANPFSGALERASGEDVGSYAITLGNLDAGSNYSLTFASNGAALDITPKPETFSFSNLWKFYTGSTLEATITISPDGGVAFDHWYDLMPTDSTPDDSVNAGSYQVYASVSATETNYSGSGSAVFHILKKFQWITFPGLSNLSHTAADFDPGATASSGLPVTYTSWGHCSIVDNKVHLDSLGFCLVSAHQSGDTNHHAAFVKKRWFWITNADPILDSISGGVAETGDEVVFTASATDADEDTITYGLVTLSPGIYHAPEINPVTGAFAWNTVSTLPGDYEFAVTADDGYGGTDSAGFIINLVAAACSDGADNDGDGFSDQADPGCHEGGATGPYNGNLKSEANSKPAGGGGGGGPLILTNTNPNPTGQVLGVSVTGDEEDNQTTGEEEEGTENQGTGQTQCTPEKQYLTVNLGIGRDNPASQVTLLQTFLNSTLGLTIPVTGTFGPQTFAGVKAFQDQHEAEVLTPWGITDPTGFVGVTTRRMIDITVCGADYPIPELP